ncbi:prohead core protein [Enterobacter phage vB-EclM_KMB20]|nr:prohead core protein [Enterobacter phage vB-EclM_KMB20]USL86154.1 prohead core protein [Enterobacter phage fGh-Ecl04]
MEDFISALKSNDLVKAKKAFGAIMLEQTADLISQRRVEIAQSIMIEGEEKEDDEDENDDSEDKGDKDPDSKDEKDSEDEDD